MPHRRTVATILDVWIRQQEANQINPFLSWAQNNELASFIDTIHTPVENQNAFLYIKFIRFLRMFTHIKTRFMETNTELL